MFNVFDWATWNRLVASIHNVLNDIASFKIRHPLLTEEQKCSAQEVLHVGRMVYQLGGMFKK